MSSASTTFGAGGTISPSAAQVNGWAQGLLGYAQITATSPTFTALTDISGLSATVTVVANRRIRITASLAVGSSVANDVFRAHIMEGSTNLQIRDTPVTLVAGTDGNFNLEFSVVVTPSAGSHTYKISCERISGTGNCQVTGNATFPSAILVEDIGAV